MLFKFAYPILPSSAAAVATVQEAASSGLSAGEYATIGAMVLVLGVALKVVDKLVDRLPKRGGGGDDVTARLGRMEDTLNETRSISAQTRDWHAPDHDGVQTWKNPRVAVLLEEIRDGIRELVAR